MTVFLSQDCFGYLGSFVFGKEVKLSLFADDMIVYIWKTLKMPPENYYNEYSKTQDIKLIQRNLLHSYTLTMKNQKERLLKQSHSSLQQKQKCLGINLLKETKTCMRKTSRTLMKEIKGDTNKWGDIPCSWVARINIVKMTMLPKLYPTLCSPMYCSLQGSSVHGILQARTLEWVAVPFSKAVQENL